MPKLKLPTAADLRSRIDEINADVVKDALVQHHRAKDDIMTAAVAAGRCDLLASEQRQVQDHMSEVSKLQVLLDEVSIDRSQIVIAGAGEARSRVDDVPMLTRDQSFAEWVQRNGRDRRGESEEVRLGALLRGWVTGRWDGATEAEQRAMAEGTAAAGGVLVPTPTAARFIDRARNATRVMRAGATTVPMNSQTLKVPRLTGSSAPAWRNENAAIAEGDLILDSVTLTARSLAFLVKISRELVEDSEPNILDVVERDLSAQVAIEIDRVALRGSGTAPEPRGVRNTSGVTVTSLGANGLSLSTGTPAPAYDPLTDAAQSVRALNFEPNAFIHAPRTENSLGKSRDSTGQYIAPPASLSGMPRYTTNQIPVNLTQGTSTDTSEIYCGQWPMMYVGLRTGPLIFQLAERYADVGQLALIIWARGDIQLAQPGAFCVVTGVRP